MIDEFFISMIIMALTEENEILAVREAVLEAVHPHERHARCLNNFAYRSQVDSTAPAVA